MPTITTDPKPAEQQDVRCPTALYQLLARLTGAKALEDAYEAAIASLLAATAADRAAILTFDSDGVMRFKAWHNLSIEYREAVTGHTPWQQGTRDAQPVVIPDVLLDGSLAAYRELFAREQIRALAFIPLALEAGVFGKFMLYYPDPHECTGDELAITQAIAGHVALVLERKQAGNALAQTELRLQAILDNSAVASRHLAAIVESSDDAIASKDLNGIITSWNKGAERMFGYTAEEIIGKPVSILAAPERVSEMPAILEKIRKGERVEHYESQRLRKDGETIHVSLSVSPVRNAAGQIIGASKIARDISDRKHAESERAVLLSREQEARRTAELLNRVGRILAVELDVEKLVQSVTDVATELLGAEFGSFFHSVVNEKGESDMLYTMSGARREAFAGFLMVRNADLFRSIFQGQGLVRCDDVNRDPRYGDNALHDRMAEGQLPVRSCLAAPVASRSGEILGGLLFAHSIPRRFTEHHEAILAGVAAQAAIAIDNARLFEEAQWVQKELKRSNEELRRANQDLETFAYSASHDLQEPLRTIALSAQLLERQCSAQLPGDARQLLGGIIQAAQRLQTLIRDVLAYATATRYTEGPAPAVNSREVLAGVLENLKGNIEEAGASITYGELPVISVHESLLTQLFQNLISNALKYRSHDAPRVHISATERDGWWVFAVVDNGIGIEKKFADRIFGLFKRLHSRDQYPGSGIGLAICQRIVEQYGGRIWLENSAPGEGSTFCFSFPANNQLDLHRGASASGPASCAPTSRKAN